MRQKGLFLLLGALLVSSSVAQASGVELFGKGSVSKNYLSVDKSTISISVTGGLAIALFSSVRIEARYSNISSLQNKLDITEGNTVLGTLSSIKTETLIYSLGLDITLAGEKSWIQPYIFVGAGYIETDRSYYYTPADNSSTTLNADPKQTGISVNGGAGFRLRVARTMALEVEVFGYGIDIHTSNPLINLYGTAGLRIYI